MPLRVNNNIAASNARRHLNNNARALSQKMERLSSGLRLNRASDDAAGLSVREGLRAEISGLKMNIFNAETATNQLQVAEGSLNEVNAILIRMQELATESANSTLTNENRGSIQSEYSQLISEIDRIAQATTYNNQTMLTGFGNTVSTASTTVTASNTSGVTNTRMSGAQAGTYTFQDVSGTDSQITLGNGTVSQTIDVGTILDGTTVATGTQVVANFDRLGIQMTLAGTAVAGATGNYTAGNLDGQTVLIESGTVGSFQVGPTDQAFNRIEINISDMRASGNILNLNTSSVSTITTSKPAMTGSSPSTSSTVTNSCLNPAGSPSLGPSPARSRNPITVMVMFSTSSRGALTSHSSFLGGFCMGKACFLSGGWSSSITMKSSCRFPSWEPS